MCQWRDNDPNDPRKGRTKVQDCGQCRCGDSTAAHFFYLGKCQNCGKKQ